MINQVFSRLKLLFAKGKVLRIGGDKVQVRALDDEPLSNIERVEPYGLSYRAKPGCQAYLVFPDGDRSYGFALVIGDKQYQMDLQEGEVALHDDEGNYVHIKRGGVIEVKAATKVLADTALFETTQDAKIGGNLVVLGQTTSDQGYGGAGGSRAWLRNGALIDVGTELNGTATCNGKNISDSHTHAETNSHTLGVD